MGAQREKFPEKYPKVIFPHHYYLGQNKVVCVVEGTPEQVTEWYVHYEGAIKLEYIPIIEATKVGEISETYQKTKK